MAEIFLAVLPSWALTLLAVLCILVAALVAGLTLGVMLVFRSSANSDRPEAEHARKLVPIREKGNFLLVSLLLANTLANELLPLVLEALFPGGYFSWVASVVLIPFPWRNCTSICSRYGLEIGSKAVSFIKALRALLYPIAYPIAWILDYFLAAVAYKPDEERTIRSILTKKKKSRKKKFASPLYASASARLEEVLDEFQQGRSHMAIVYDDVSKPEGQRKFMGIVTLEDIIEEILQEEIVDETDVYMDMKTKKPVLFRGPDGRLHRRAFIGTKKPHTQITIREIDFSTLKHSSSDPNLLATKKVTEKNSNKQVMRPDVDEWSLRNLAYTTDDIEGYESDSDEASDNWDHASSDHAYQSNSKKAAKKEDKFDRVYSKDEQQPLLGGD
eukprot:jgi/Galph1/4808/GphlegSOOS_G3445.1